MRRREVPAPVLAARLDRFVYGDWADDSEPVPELFRDEVWMFRRLRAFKRYLAAKREAGVA